MKKILCVVLIVLTMVAVFTGCAGRAYTTGRYRNGSTGIGKNDQSNVSTSRDGTVNGKNKDGMPKMGMDVEIGPGVR